MDLAIVSIDGDSCIIYLASLPPTGSFSPGNISPPQIDHADTAVTIPANAKMVSTLMTCDPHLQKRTQKGVARLHRSVKWRRHLDPVLLSNPDRRN